jgi:SAM-dependent methyltransferase
MDHRLRAAAAERNRAPILAVLSRVLPARGTVLELASGTGQHAVFFAAALSGLVWQPSERDPRALESIAAWRESEALPNVRAPLRLDVHDQPWPVDRVDAVFNANLIHIAPWETALALLRGVGRHLQPGGALVLYGPYRIGGRHTAASNADFDRDLRARDPAWGVRELEAVAEAARACGLALEERVEMPANNQTLIFRRVAAADRASGS